MLSRALSAGDTTSPKPNIILCMTDDQGWGDTGYNGHPVLRTPNLDQMAKGGIRFDRFYSGAPVCSPTRGSCITGRHPYRYGITYANRGHMKREEVTLAEVLKTQGYTTGHFGKWHLGTLTTKIKDSNRGKPGKTTHYSPPWENGFDVCFSTEAKVPTWDPMKNPKTGEPYGTYYWTGADRMATDNLEGDDSRVIMDRAIPFVRKAITAKTPFLAVIWFHTPHLPVVAGPTYRKMYQGHPGAGCLGCITAMDDQVGRLRKELTPTGSRPEHHALVLQRQWPRRQDRYQGKRHRKALARPETQTRPYDGVSLLPLIKGKMTQRPRPIAFESRNQVCLTDNRYKIYSKNRGKTYELYDLIDDPGEKNNIAKQHPDIVKSMKRALKAWRQSCKHSLKGKDYRKTESSTALDK